jgi:hypothetical protein
MLLTTILKSDPALLHDDDEKQQEADSPSDGSASVL